MDEWMNDGDPEGGRQVQGGSSLEIPVDLKTQARAGGHTHTLFYASFPQNPAFACISKK